MKSENQWIKYSGCVWVTGHWTHLLYGSAGEGGKGVCVCVQVVCVSIVTCAASMNGVLFLVQRTKMLSKHSPDPKHVS